MQRSIDTHLFEWPSRDPRLIGSECEDCGVVTFPRQTTCPSCCGSNVKQRRLGASGRLWTWTTQAFLPKPPYAVARTAEEHFINHDDRVVPDLKPGRSPRVTVIERQICSTHQRGHGISGREVSWPPRCTGITAESEGK